MKRQDLALKTGLKAMKHRDVSFIDISDNEVLVTACDSCGGIGSKEGDAVQAPPYIVGKFTARVCLMELLSVNSVPIGMTVNICSEPEPTGSEILRGIEDELGEINLNIPMTISTEKNMKTSMTALGITLFGRAKKEEILLGRAEKGNYVYTLGEPMVGVEVLRNHEKTCSSRVVLELLKDEDVREIIPVGSGGIGGELDKFLKNSGFKLDYEDFIDVDMKKSGGPNTVAVIISRKKLLNSYGLPAKRLGRIK